MTEVRRAAPRRRTFRIKVKWDPHVIGRRFKLYVPKQVPELAWEIQILEELEKRVYAILEAQMIPIRPDDPYVKFAKRLWERAVHFDPWLGPINAYTTFQLEKTSLLNEFTLRGLDPDTLALIQVEAEALAKLKLFRLLPPAWAYDNVIGSIWMQEWGGYDNRLPGTGYIWEPEGSNGGYYDNRE